MNNFKSVLSGRGLLAASIAMLSGHAVAETAGRVTFISGEVTASSPDGSTRALRRGDAINGGDKISTRAGRLQIRFTDGGFVSLQPNSVFGVDEYLYSNRKPEETSLFFSLLQGGMRTITGTIGKVNKKSYQVRTPVATIGIRGTEYLASVNDTGLTVSVGTGFVYVENGLGNVIGGAGQNITVPNKESAPALGRERASVRATGTRGDRSERRAEEGREDNRSRDTIAIGNVLDGKGEYIFLFKSNAFPSGPGYTAAYSYSGGLGVQGGYYNGGGLSDTSLTVLFDDKGSLQLATQNSNGSPAVIFDRKLAVDLGSNSVGALKWGAWAPIQDPLVDGTPVVVDGISTTIFGKDAVHYIVGGMTPVHDFAQLPFNGQATYKLQGGTLATTTNLDGTSTLGRIQGDSVLAVTFGSTPVVSADIGVAMDDGAIYRFTGTANVGVSISPAGTSSSASATGIATFAATNMGCTVNTGSGICGASMSGFFAGAQAQQIGLAYQIDDNSTSNNRTVNGTGAFGRGPVSTPSPQ